MHITSTTLALALALLSGAPIAPTDGTTDGSRDEGADVARVFDVSALAIDAGSDDEPARPEQLLPMMRASRDWYGVEVDHGSDVVNSLVDAFLSEFEDDVARIDTLAGGQVLVEGTEEVVDRFGAVLGLFQASLNVGTDVDLVRFTAPAGALTGMVDRSALEAVLESAEDVLRHTLTARLDGALVLEDHRSTTVGIGVSTEIAQGIAMHRVDIRDVLTGFRLQATTRPTPGGLDVAYVISQHAAAEGPVNVPVLSTTKLFSDGRGIESDMSAAWQEPFAVEGGTVGGELSLANGQYAVLCTSSDGVTARYCALGIERESGAVPAMQLANGHRLLAVPRGAVSPPQFEITAALGGGPSVLGTYAASAVRDDDAAFAARARFADDSTMDYVFDRMGGGASFDLAGATLVMVPDGAVERFEAAVALAAGPQRTRFTVTATVHDGERARSASLLALGGRPAAVVIGAEHLVAKRYETEVAQHVGALNPTVETAFDGAALSLTLARLADGRLAYRTAGQMTTTDRITPSRANSAGGGGLVAVKASHLGLTARGASDPEDGAWTIVLGDRTGAGASVTLQVRELP